jgi:hypothetical protein
MAIPFLDFLNIGSKIIDKVIPDKAAAAKAKENLAVMHAQGEFDQLKGQMEINKVEAASKSVFVAGWRPAVGWVCACGIGVDVILRPLANWFSTLIAHPINAPALDMSTLLPLLASMLGFGAYRTYEKIKGTANGQ